MNLAALLPLLRLMANGANQSGEALGAALGVSRAAVWKQVQELERFGLVVQANKGQGYCLTEPLDLFDEPRLAEVAKALGLRLHCLAELASTNTFLLQRPAHGELCVSEWQSAGRGRRGRRWLSPLGRNLTLSLCIESSRGVAAFEGLSLAVGAVLADLLAKLGANDIRLKWPNDLLARGRKLGGILIEVGGDLAGDCFAVVGLGLNVHMQAADAGVDNIEQPWISLDELGLNASRTDLAAVVIEGLAALGNTYADSGFAAYRAAWLARAAYLQQAVVLLSPGGQLQGTFSGIDEQGGLLMTDAQGNQSVHTGGEISLRSAL